MLLQEIAAGLLNSTSSSAALYCLWWRESQKTLVTTHQLGRTPAIKQILCSVESSGISPTTLGFYHSISREHRQYDSSYQPFSG